MNGKKTVYLDSFGFGMCSVNTIKKHLKDLIPKIIILDDDLGCIEATTSEYTGMIILNMCTFIEKKINIQKDTKDKIKNEHYGFILSKIFFHETFGHKKTGLNKNNGIFLSAKCFKDKNNDLRLVYKQFGTDQFFTLNNGVYFYQDSKEGESGTFLEFFLGKLMVLLPLNL